jgi:hypothetical protein
MTQLPPSLNRLGDDLEAAAQRAIAAEKARRAAIRRAIVVVLVSVTPAVLLMPEALSPLRPASLRSLTPSADPTYTELGADEASVAARIRFSSYRSRPAPAVFQTDRPFSMPNRVWGEPRARL